MAIKKMVHVIIDSFAEYNNFTCTILLQKFFKSLDISIIDSGTHFAY